MVNIDDITINFELLKKGTKKSYIKLVGVKRYVVGNIEYDEYAYVVSKIESDIPAFRKNDTSCFLGRNLDNLKANILKIVYYIVKNM